MIDKRPSWTQYFLNVAEVVSTRATCPRRAVGSVIVKDKQILSSGYNGAVRNTSHCTEVGCLIEDNHCQRVIHSEVNALIQAAKYGISVNEATIYINTFPCFNCTKLLINSGIKRIIFNGMY